MRIRVLLADDHTMVREALAQLIGGEPDIELVGLASDGREAVIQAKALRPDLALLDISMPEINGFEAAAQIRKYVPGCRVIALSALGDDCFVNQMVAAGAQGYVLKSESAQTLVECIRKVHGGQICLPEVRSAAPRTGTTLLSRREREVLTRIGQGRRGSEIASDMGVAVKTVDTYRRRIMQKFGLNSQSELVRYALALGGGTETPTHSQGPQRVGEPGATAP
ncbi:MAG: response regulator transcription factor [Chromatiaceae bacterium]|jgi:DNA-binding NarL/FixJ family response regulator